MPCTRLTLENEILLLNFFRDNPCLWHSKHSDYSNKKVRNAKLNEAAQLIQVDSGKDAYEKFRNLRTTYYRELKRTTEIEGHKSKWRHFTRMSFLRQSMNELENDDTHNDDSLVSERSGHGELEVSVVTNHSLNSSGNTVQSELSHPTHVQSIITPLNSQVLYTVNSDKLAITNVDGTNGAQLSALPGQIVSSNIVNTRILQPHPGVGQRLGSPMIISRAALPNGVGPAPTLVGVSSPKSKNVSATTMGASQLITVNPTGQFYSVVTESPPSSSTSNALPSAKRSHAAINSIQNSISTPKTAHLTPSVGSSGSSAKRTKPSSSSSSSSASLSSRSVALLHSPTVSQHQVQQQSLTPVPGQNATIVSPAPTYACNPLASTPLTNHDGMFVKKTDLKAIIKTEFQKLISEDSDLLFALSITQSLKNLSPTARESLKLSIQKCVLDITIENSNLASAQALSQQITQSIPSVSNHTISYQVPGHVQVQVSNGLNNLSSDINGHKNVNGHTAISQTTQQQQQQQQPPPPTLCVVSGTLPPEQTNGPEHAKTISDTVPIVCVNSDLRTTTAITSVQSETDVKNERR